MTPTLAKLPQIYYIYYNCPNIFSSLRTTKYVKSTGDGDDALAESSVLGYISAIMAARKDKFENEDSEFFKVMGGRNSSLGLADNWYVSMNNGIGKAIRHRSIEAGEKVGGDRGRLFCP